MGTLVFQATLGGAVNIIGPNIANTINFTLPSADGTSGQTWTTNGSGVLAFGTLGIAGGGTGQITATAAFNALAPSQSGQSGKYLTTDGTNTSWGTNPLGTVTSVGGTGTVNGITLTGTVTTSGNLTLGGTLSGVSLTSQVTGILPTANGGTNLGGATPFTSGGVVYASSTSALATGSALYFDGTNLGVGTTSPYSNAAFSTLTLGGSSSSKTGLIALATSAGTDSAHIDVFNTQLRVSTNGTTNPIVFYTGGGVSEAMRIDSSQNVGIGTSSPAYKLDVVGGLITANLRYATVGTGNTALLRFSVNNNFDGQSLAAIGAYSENANTTATSLIMQTEAAGGAGLVTRATLDSAGNLGLGVTPNTWTDLVPAFQIGNAFLSAFASNAYSAQGANAYYNSGWKYRTTAAASVYQQNGGEHSWSSAASGTAGNAITFTQAMTLDASGNLLVGKTSTSFSTNGMNFTAGGLAELVATSSTVIAVNRLTTDGDIVDFYRQTSKVGSISVTSSATAYNTSSDYRLKNTIAPMTGALAKVALLKPCTYKWNADGSDGEGFIAHELAEVVPQCVSGEKDAVDEEGNPKYQGIDTSFLVATLTAALQEAVAKITALEARLDAANL